MKCIIAGSRTITDFYPVNMAVYRSGWQGKITEVVCGDTEENVEEAGKHRHDADAAKYMNVDILGALWGLINGLPVKYFPAKWDDLDVPGAVVRFKSTRLNPYNAKAGPDRNEQMAAYADALILVWDGKSKGSADMWRRARAHGLRVYEHIVGVTP